MWTQNEELARCDREIADSLKKMGEPAYRVAIWANDWAVERRLILQETEKGSLKLPPQSAGACEGGR